MAEAIPPLRSLPPDAPLPLPAPFINPNPNSDISIPSSSRTLDQGEGRDQVEFPYRFQRTDLWKPAYDFLESLDKDTLVTQKEVSDWLDANPDIFERLSEKHSRYHLVHYTQRMHLKMLKKKGKLPKSLQLSEARASIKPSIIGGVIKQRISIISKIKKRDTPITGNISGAGVKEKKMLLSKKKEAFIKYELLTDLQNQLISILAKHKPTIELKQAVSLSHHTDKKASDSSSKPHLPDLPRVEPKPEEPVTSVRIIGTVEPRALFEGQVGHKRKRVPVIVTPAWSYNEVPPGCSKLDQPSSSDSEDAQRRRHGSIWKGERESERSPLEGRRKSIVSFVQGRERGASWRISSCYSRYAGRGQEKWIPFYEGWNSLSRQFEGPTADIKRRNYKSWAPTWCAYTSNVSSGQLTDRQSPQKVLHVKFHPEGLPQIVCGSNKGPNELLLYNLRSGRALQLKGHTSLIQAVDFAARGASVVSCSSNLVKVWDCITGSCLYTLGGDNQNSTGHTERINAMAVNRWQSCLIVTSGAKGDGKLLLWNALRGELVGDLNSNLRSQDMVYPSILTMEFSQENLLICGSDAEHGSSSVVQLWDVECAQSCLSFPASDSYVSSLKVNPSGCTVITGSGDGTIDLFDVRTCSPINHLSLGPDSEVTSVSFSGCGTYFSASSTSNSTLVWDTRFIPTNTSKDTRFFRPLHCLSHSDSTSSGDHDVNDARWLQREPVLVTVSSDGSMAMWDVTLGRPFLRRALSHTRSVNTVDVAMNDEYLCTGGDDQKIVSLSLSLSLSRARTPRHTHTHTHGAHERKSINLIACIVGISFFLFCSSNIINSHRGKRLFDFSEC
ncbi:Eukaryotic translation initiation factor 3 subunit I [Rhynchospora pubera]|uniref:Eukaryotic translation initiation factor 3 subunit I n=1 Tax=Rhynchospora pubera TaxID=906938 RepID=A0AAV8GM86_9POAL|nr:Eukaryotic translation initiation factor 3 subunit I [Rhynchospora pubera]